MSRWESFPARAVRGILTGVIEGGSQYLSLATFGWFNPWRDPPGLPFLSTSSRAGRGVEQGFLIWRIVAPTINAVFRLPILDGEWGHCARSWAGYQRQRGAGTKEITGLACVTAMAVLALGIYLLG